LQRNVRKVLAIAVILASSAILLPRPIIPQGEATDKGSFTFSGCIDGSDFLHLQGSGLWIVHRNFNLPGWHGSCPVFPYPFTIGASTWQPIWYTDTSRTVQYDPNCCSGFGPPGTTTSIFTLPQSIVVTGFTIVQARGSVTVVQTASESNNFEAVILFNDDPEFGPAVYTIDIQFTGTLQAVSYTHLTLPTICSV